MKKGCWWSKGKRRGGKEKGKKCHGTGKCNKGKGSGYLGLRTPSSVGNEENLVIRSAARRKPREISQENQRQFQVFIVHLKSSSAMLWMTFLSETNPPIHQKIPLDVSSCHLRRAPEPLAFQPLVENHGSSSSNTASHSCQICNFTGTSNQLTLAAGHFSRRSLHRSRCHGRLVNWYNVLTTSRFRNRIWCGWQTGGGVLQRIDHGARG